MNAVFHSVGRFVLVGLCICLTCWCCRASLAFLFPVSFIGAFVLLSMILALMENAYTTATTRITKQEQLRRHLCMTSLFGLIWKASTDDKSSTSLRQSTTVDAGAISDGAEHKRTITKSCLLSFLLLAWRLINKEELDKRVIKEVLEIDEEGDIDKVGLSEFNVSLIICQAYSTLKRDMLLCSKVAAGEYYSGEDQTERSKKKMKQSAEESIARHQQQVQQQEYLIILGSRVWCWEVGFLTVSFAHGWVLCWQSDWASWISVGVNLFSAVYLLLRCFFVDTDGDLNGDGVLDEQELAARREPETQHRREQLVELAPRRECFKSMLQSAHRFWYDPRGKRFSIQNRVVCVATIVGTVGMFIYVFSDKIVTGYSDQSHESGDSLSLQQGAQFMMALPLLRVFVEYSPFLNIVYTIRRAFGSLFSVMMV